MKHSENRAAVSLVCLVQLALCALLFVLILLFRQFGGKAYEDARRWYLEKSEDTVLVYPELWTSSEPDA